MTIRIRLRPLDPDDLAIFFDQQRDPDACRMAAFTPRDPNDRDAFLAHWAKIAGEPSIVHRTIVADDDVAGYVAKFEREGVPEVCYFLAASTGARASRRARSRCCSPR